MGTGTQALRKATLEAAASNGLRFVRKRARGMIFELSDGLTFRLRTSTARCLICTATDPDPSGADIDLDGTDYLVFGVPALNNNSRVEVYYIRTDIAVATVKKCHKRWLEVNGVSAGHNRTFVVWLDDKMGESGNFAEKWRIYRIV
jgi:hypothetical protein